MITSNKPSMWRYYLIGGIFTMVSALIVLRASFIQFSPQAGALEARGKSFQRTIHIFYPARGQIYDRWGNLLAGNQRVYEVGVDKNIIENPQAIAFAMSTVLKDHPGYNYQGYYDKVLEIASGLVMTQTTYSPLADFVTQKQVDELKEWARRYAELPPVKNQDTPPASLKGLVYRPRLQRFYPEKELASNILGFVSWDGKGIYGVEEKFNDILAGEPQIYWVTMDPYQASQMPKVDNGADLVLTIDRDIQSMLEEELDRALNNSGASGGTIVAADPKTGEILGMASTPRIDLNRYWDYGDFLNGSSPYNRAVSEDYEPGSVFKVLTMASALDAGAVEANTVFNDSGVIEIGGIVIYNWNYGAWGPQDMLGCMQHSLNVCLTWVATQLGNERFYQYMQKFGVGHLTGIDLAKEVAGRLKLPGDTDWSEADLGTNSFGQGVAVTPVQMVMAVSAVANHGNMMMPHVLRSMVVKGKQYTPLPTILGNPINAQTADDLSNLLSVSLEQESSDALVEGYRVAGKTGTAQIPGVGGYDPSATNASFVGWGPVDDPQFIVYVWLERPTSSPWGSVVASPVFRDVVKRLVVLMNIPPDSVRTRLNASNP